MRDLIITYSCIALFQIVTVACKSQNEELRGDDIRLFSGPIAKLAEAVEKEDTARIQEVLNKNKNLINYREPRFGQTLLHWAVTAGRKESIKTLLKNGADPNLQDSYDGASPLMIASSYGPNYDTTADILKLLLQFGGDPNAEEKKNRREGNTTRNTPLLNAAGCCLNKVKVLVEAGADINHANEFNESALTRAMIGGRDAVYITKYLLIEKNAEVPEYFSISYDGKKITILNYLRNWVFDLDSKEYRVKMEIVKYLKIKGLNYWETPVPKVFYKNYSKDFLEKY